MHTGVQMKYVSKLTDARRIRKLVSKEYPKNGVCFMKKLFAQIMKFGVVGVICFGVDYVIGLSVMKIIVRL